MKLFQEVRLALRRMPFMLRWSTGMCLGFALFLPATFLPFGEHVIDGKEVSFIEFWKQGGGPIFTGIGVLATVLAYGFIRATRWVRPLAVATGLAVTVLAILDEQRITWEIMMMVILTSAVWPGYLFLRAGVQQYFGETRKPGVPNRDLNARKQALHPETPRRR